MNFGCILVVADDLAFLQEITGNLEVDAFEWFGFLKLLLWYLDVDGVKSSGIRSLGVIRGAADYSAGMELPYCQGGNIW